MDLDTDKIAALAARFDAVSIEIFDDVYQAKVDAARAAKGFAPKKQAEISGKPEAVFDEINRKTTNGESV